MASAMPQLRLPSRPQSITALWLVPNCTAWWQRHMGVNNLPRVVAWRCCGRESNPGPLGLESNTLTTTPPSHLGIIRINRSDWARSRNLSDKINPVWWKESVRQVECYFITRMYSTLLRHNVPNSPYRLVTCIMGVAYKNLSKKSFSQMCPSRSGFDYERGVFRVDLILNEYTPWAIKTCHFYFYHNFGKCGPISIILSLLDS